MNKPIYRAKAPFRIGLAGGGTDVSPFCDRYGGAILNATVSLYAHATLQPLDENVIIIQSLDQRQEQRFEWSPELPLNNQLDLHKGVFNRIQKDFGLPMTGFRLSTWLDAPAASGLGTSSTLVVAIIGVFSEMLRLPLGEYDIAHYAYEIERLDLGLAGGRQDQYAATFGGVNFMEFSGSDQVIVNPLRVKQRYLLELENNLLIYHTQLSRESAGIIGEQVRHVEANYEPSIQAMQLLKQQAVLMKESLLKGRIDDIGEILDYGFQQKRKMAAAISNEQIEAIYQTAKAAGATGGKISGAGGGGFMSFYCPGVSKYPVMEALQSFGGEWYQYEFVKNGLRSWTI